MQDIDRPIAELGNEPPLLADGQSGPPDRREVSARWLSGTFLTGITSSVLMGVALLAALDGRVLIATPPEIADLMGLRKAGESGEQAKEERVFASRQIARAKDRRRIEVSVASKVGDREVIRAMPLMGVNMALAASYKNDRDYPPFDPLMVFAEPGSKPEAPAPGQIYAAKVESEMVLKTAPFPIETANFDESAAFAADEVEQVVRTMGAILTDGDVQVASLHFVDPERFGDSFETQTLTASYGFKITPENVSVAPKEASDDDISYAEDIIPITSPTTIEDALKAAGYAGNDSAAATAKLNELLHSPTLKEGQVLRIGLELKGETPTIVRAALYQSASSSNSILCVALNDQKAFVPAQDPDPTPALQAAFDDSPPVMVSGNLPTVYDAINRAASSYGISRSMTRSLLRLFASDVDFQSRVNPTDRMELLFSEPDEDNRISDDSQLLYVSASFGGQTKTLYRFQSPDGGVDYFDKDGRNNKQFLLRTAAPNGRFTSGFGMRRHPVLGYARMHTGVDWAAPTGTPILATGSGVVEKAGWSGAYGRQTIIRHANGYKTSYNHQSAIAKGIKPGARVRQGQIIGYVGSTGLVTGAHLHYELIVNGAKVDPMRVRLPAGKTLRGEELTAFKLERDRIDEIMKENESGQLKLASTKGNDS
ncbi:MAG: M23 family metallopeptidase [Rhizobiaceae bacterium]|nr:M23 family metallopeptidase [Rhizobiaceae bacterium]